MFAFIFLFVLMFLSMGLFFGLAFTGNLHGFVRVIAVILIGALIAGAITALMYLEFKSDIKVWNDGVCGECGSSWTLIDVERNRHGSTTYFYECEKCGRVIRTSRSMRG